MTKARKIAHWVSTGLVSLMMMLSAGMYIFDTPQITGLFEGFGYPTYLVIPLAIAKLFGIVALWVRRSPTLTGLAYAGFFYDFIQAFFAHSMIGDGGQGGASIALVLITVSYFSGKRLVWTSVVE